MKPEYTAYAITLIGVMGVSAITPGLPEIARTFSISSAEVSMLITFFTLPGVFFSPLTGLIADKVGRKPVASTAIFVFGISGFLCPFYDFRTMLFLRFIQGISASSLVALSTTIIGDTYTGIEREKLIGYNASILTVGIAFYQLAGGFLAHINWRYPFYIFLLAIPVGLFVLLSPVKDVKSEKLVKLKINRKLIFLFFLGFTAYSLLYGTFLAYIPFVVYSLGGTSITVGLVQATMSISTAFFAANLVRISKRLKKFVIPVGFLSYAISLIAVLVSMLTKCEQFLIACSLMFGYAQGTVLPTLQHSVVSLTESKGRATIMSIYGSVSKLGQTFGPAFFGLFPLEVIYIVGTLLAISVSAISKQVLKLKSNLT